MPQARQLMAAGVHPTKARAILLGDVGAALTAAGNNQATALALTTNSAHMVTTAAASTGLRLPLFSEGSDIGDTHIINNGGANTLTVYPGVGDTINALSANTGKTVAAASGALCVRVSATAWFMIVGS